MPSAPRSSRNFLRAGRQFSRRTFADYLVPTAMEVPAPKILHIETPSLSRRFAPKGVGEGNCMRRRCAIANAVADALSLAAIDLPLAPAKLAAFVHPPSPCRNAQTFRPIHAPYADAPLGEGEVVSAGA